MATRTTRSRKQVSAGNSALQQELTDVLVSTVTNVVTGKRRILELIEALSPEQVVESFNAARKRLGPMPRGSEAAVAFDAIQKRVRRWLARKGMAVSFDAEHEIYNLRKAAPATIKAPARKSAALVDSSSAAGSSSDLVPSMGTAMRPSAPAAMSLAELIDVILALPPEDQDVIVHVIENQRSIRGAVSENGGKGASSSRRAH